ncbi:MAG TPA: DUF1080 domain-containing protein [Phycisphaerae bacterium]|nr:DUF1080 domain-containing protein [Phycisphaerae bacterium]HNU45020.1 DUF1080 domain-containing protein [Phycisphaerae bacterium]
MLHIAVLVLAVNVISLADAQAPAPVPAEELANVAAALPGKAVVAPTQPRKLLVFSLCRGFVHDSIPLAAQTLEMLGKKTGAYDAVLTSDVDMLHPDKLAHFDAVCFNNTTGELFDNPVLRQGLLDFVRSGKGFIGIHAATDCFYKWSAYGEMVGGYFDGHPWNEKVTVKIDEPTHPLVAAFGGQAFPVADEIYQFGPPYSRDALRVLLSLDTSKTDMTKQGIKRTDGDFAVSWVRNYGKGRVFFCSLGHRHDIFWNPAVLQHYLAGIQFALGDLKAPADPLPARAAAPPPVAAAAAPVETEWVTLFNGEDLAGWKGLVGDPVSRAKMTPDELAKAQQEADARMREHWQVVDGVLVFGGKGENLCTVKDYGNFELLVDWKIEAGGDSGIYLRGSPQVQIWDIAKWPDGSGGLYNNQRNAAKPLAVADKPIGEWNTFRIRMVGDRVTVHLNDVLVVDNVVMENYWERDKTIYASGPIELQSHNSPLFFRNIKIRELPPGPAPDEAAWDMLFNGKDLTGWSAKEGTWIAEDGVLTRVGGGDIWTQERFGDFVLDLEFKLAAQTNSGVFLRTGSIEQWLHTGIEVQVLDSFGKAEPDKHDCGAIYDCLKPSKNMVKPAGEWNHYTITCKGSRIQVVLNGEQIIDMNLNLWTEAHKNPDGTPNKFNTAYKDMPRVGHVGLQDHGVPIWYRNIKIKRLDAKPEA